MPPNIVKRGETTLLGCWVCGWDPSAACSAADLSPAGSLLDQGDSPSEPPTHEARDCLEQTLCPVQHNILADHCRSRPYQTALEACKQQAVLPAVHSQSPAKIQQPARNIRGQCLTKPGAVSDDQECRTGTMEKGPTELADSPTGLGAEVLAGDTAGM